MEVVSTREGYRRWAEIYDSEGNPLKILEERHIGDLAGDVSGLKFVDIGCGTGRIALRLSAQGARVTAVDFSDAMLQQARRKPDAGQVLFIQHDLGKLLPLESGAFARVFCCLVLDHIVDLKGLFSEMGRICEPTGAIVVSVMHPAMSLRGVQARFIEPETGRRVSPAGYAHQMSDYIMAATSAGLRFADMSEHAADSELVARSPRAQRYLGWPMLLLMKLAPGN